VYTPHDLLEGLNAIVPRPRAHLTRYFGVFAPAFAARAGLVPSTDPDPAAEAAHQSIERARDRSHTLTLTPGELLDLFAAAGLTRSDAFATVCPVYQACSTRSYPGISTRSSPARGIIAIC
jgi:hypothetical protein